MDPDNRMILDFDKWCNREERHEQLERHVSETRTAKFGFTTYAESDKRHRVNRHFNSIATRYDLMNTILSGGIHYAWKRRAVETLMIKPEEKSWMYAAERVIWPVCPHPEQAKKVYLLCTI